jgi:hypothetical protein
VPGSNLCGYPTCWDDANGAYAVSFSYDPGDPDNDDVWDTEEICKLHCIDPTKWYCNLEERWTGPGCSGTPFYSGLGCLIGGDLILTCHYDDIWDESIKHTVVSGPYDDFLACEAVCYL